jgi:transposase
VSYLDYAPSEPLLVGYDPVCVLHKDHLARFVDRLVDECIEVSRGPVKSGRPAFDPRLCLKVLIYGYAIGVRSSRQLERQCDENLGFLLLTRGLTPSYRTLCSVRTDSKDQIEAVWDSMFAVAADAGIKRLGRIFLDSTKLAANASPESVIKAADFAAFRSELARIMAEAVELDAIDEQNDKLSQTHIDKAVPKDHMREVIRRVHKMRAGEKAGLTPEAEPLNLGPGMLKRIEAAAVAIDNAQQAGEKHVSLTDPDAKMMGEGRSKRVRECHSFEVAVDNGLLVVGQTSQSPTDNCRLVPIVNAAELDESVEIVAVTADSGYYSGSNVCVLENAGIATCIPDSDTAHDLHLGRSIGAGSAMRFGNVPLTYASCKDSFECPESNVLSFHRIGQKDGQSYREYRATQSCETCPLIAECIKATNNHYKSIKVRIDYKQTSAVLERFNSEEHQRQYLDRAHAVETVFAVVRTVLKFTRWSLRGAPKVEAEGALLKTALQIRRIQSARLASKALVAA